MQEGKFNVLLDAFWGSSGKGKTSSWLADRHKVVHVSSSNFPNAGHSVVFEDGWKFVAKAIPTAAALKRARGTGIQCFVSPGSGFFPDQLLKEWEECGRPTMYVHDRASIVTEEHARREREGSDSTKHIASTMQGSGAAIADKVLRKPGVLLAKDGQWHDVLVQRAEAKLGAGNEFREKVQVLSAMDFRALTMAFLGVGNTWLHEGSQGYALSSDHGSHYPNCTSRNCTVQAAMDQMAVPPSLVGDVYLNLRTHPIRVGNVVEDGRVVGDSGGFYEDCREMTWEEVARESGMPQAEAAVLAERERTTVTKRIRRVCTFSFLGLADAVRTNGATKLVMNFIQYVNWEDAGLKGGPEAFKKLSKKSREFIDKVECAANIPVALVGTGAAHDEMIWR
jgi:adenylosuccinate synthase